MKISFTTLLLFLSFFYFSQQKKVVDFTDIKYIDGIAYFDSGKKIDGAISKNRMFGPYYESFGKTFIFKEGILFSEINYFTDVPENIIAKQIFYYPETSQMSKMIIFQNKKHSAIKTYEFFENGKRRSIETIENGKIKYYKNFENE